MDRKPVPALPEIHAQVERIEASDVFARSERLCRFLRFVVEQSLEGKAAGLKEYSIGIEVYDKGKDFDPRLDSAVRVDARRLRAKLAEYYSGPGAADAVRIELPKGGYVPVFTGATQPGKRASISRLMLAASGVAAVALVMLGARLMSGVFDAVSSASGGHVVRAVAVLPFANLTGKPENNSLCEGFVDELTGRLAGIPGLRVVSQLSASVHKDPRGDIRKVASRLRVDAVLEGSVRQSANGLRITANLVRGHDGSHVWSEALDLSMSDPVGIQSQVGQRVAQRFTTGPEGGPHDPRLENLTKSAVHLVQRRTESSLQMAIESAEEGILSRPEYAPGHAVLSDAYFNLADYRTGEEAESLIARSRRSAEKALALSSGLAGPLATLGVIALDYQWQWDEAEDLFRRSLARNPSHAPTYARYARLLSLQGRFDASLEQARRSEILAPLSVQSAATVAHTLFFGRRYEQAIQAMERALRIEPGYDSGRLMIARAYGLLGKFDKAWRFADSVTAHEGAEPAAVKAWLLAVQGRLAEAKPLLSRIDGAASTSRAGAHLAAGDRDSAWRILERAVQARDQNAVYLKVSPSLDPLRTDARLETLCRKVGLSGCVAQHKAVDDDHVPVPRHFGFLESNSRYVVN